MGVALMLWYVVAFLSAILIDSIPVFAPPAWTVLVFFVVKFDLNVWIVALLGVVGTTIGRYILSVYMPLLGNKIFAPKENDNVKYIGEKLSRNGWGTFLFVLGYSLTPLSTTALFTAAGAAHVKPMRILPPFFIGKLISYTLLIHGGNYAAQNIADAWSEGPSLKSIVVAVLGIIVLGLLLLVDWRALFEHKTFKLNLNVFKFQKREEAEAKPASAKG
ncbi:MAG TPA: hypothetical protein VEK08_11970 [Planctomycetota bacterium]|nr:hypothetical protein [Planctomycetota bacterium]